MWLCMQDPINTVYNPVKFGGHRHSISGDRVVLVGHMISQDHMIRGPCKPLDMWLYAYQGKLYLAKFGGYKYCGSGDIKF